MNESALTIALQECSLHSLLIVTSRVLSREGFGDVQILDRRDSKQKSRFGGFELLCQNYLGAIPIKIIVKVINDTGRLRMMDELAGAVIRSEAHLGLLVTPCNLTKNAARHLGNSYGARIEAFSGETLADLLRKHGIGVRPSGDVDYAFFGELEHLSTHLLNFIKEEL